jgi:hypothetical protein
MMMALLPSRPIVSVSSPSKATLKPQRRRAFELLVLATGLRINGEIRYYWRSSGAGARPNARFEPKLRRLLEPAPRLTGEMVGSIPPERS